MGYLPPCPWEGYTRLGLTAADSNVSTPTPPVSADTRGSRRQGNCDSHSRILDPDPVCREYSPGHRQRNFAVRYCCSGRAAKASMVGENSHASGRICVVERVSMGYWIGSLHYPRLNKWLVEVRISTRLWERTIVSGLLQRIENFVSQHMLFPEVDDRLCTPGTEVIDTIGAIVKDIGRRVTCILEVFGISLDLVEGKQSRCASKGPGEEMPFRLRIHSRSGPPACCG